MKQKNVVTKPNITLRRRIRIYYNRLKLLLKILILLTLYLMFFTNSLDRLKYWFIEHFYEYSADLSLVLENVIIEGQNNMSTDQIIPKLNADVSTPILSIDIDKVRSELASNSWVKKVIVTRRLPNTIYIGLIEREPVAILQQNKKLYLIDSEGYIIQNDPSDKFKSLLHVVGVNANLHVKSLKDSLKDYPELSQKILSAVRYGDRRWNIIFDQNITVKMPERHHFDEAIAYVDKMYKNDKLFDQNYQYIDLRDNTKYFFTKYKSK